MILFFVPEKLPRSMTKDEWRAAWRWKRETEKRLRAELDRQVENLVVFGTTHPELAADIAARIVNPPLLLSPWHDAIK